MRALTLPVLLGSLVVAACTTQVVDRAADGPTPLPDDAPVVGGAELSSVAPSLSVERFLQAVNVEDLDAMGRVFGTARGPARGEPLQLERELALIARILRHEDYSIVSDRREFGREHRTHRIGIDLTIDGRVIRDVGFSVVQAPDGRWFIEVIELEKVTGA